MVEHAVPTDVVDAGDDLRADVEYLGRHPLVRYACAAAALSASMFAVTRTIRAQEHASAWRLRRSLSSPLDRRPVSCGRCPP